MHVDLQNHMPDLHLPLKLSFCFERPDDCTGTTVCSLWLPPFDVASW